MKCRHIDMNPKSIGIRSLNAEKGMKLSDLELFFILVEGLINDKISHGRKGKILANEEKMSYKYAASILYELYAYFAAKGCFSFGICGTCKKFGNAMTVSGMLGECRGQERHAFESCNEHSIEGGGFGI